MKKIIAIFAVVIALPYGLMAQGDEDALRYSMMNFGGTARSLGSANAFGALGGDFSTLSMNPAGLGIYRTSELIFSPGITNFDYQSDFYGTGYTSGKTNFQISNAGLVLTNMKTGAANADDKWVSTNFAFGYNRLEDYNSRVAYTGFNPNNSLTNYYVSQLNADGGTNPGSAGSKFPFGASLAWETYLLNPNVDDTTSYFSIINGGNVQQTKNIITSGAYDEMVFSFAGNYGNKLYIGVTLGVPIVNYSSVVSYTEEDVNDVHPDFDNFSLVDNLQVNGTGINGKFGFIYRLSNFVRLGGAIHTPTNINLSENYFSSMSSSLENGVSYSINSPNGRYDYRLVTPFRAFASAALTFQKVGFISFDYEFVDYSDAFFSFNRFSSVGEVNLENSLNNTIDQKYSNAHNFKVGAELMHEIFRVRGGYSIMATPFADGVATGGADFSRNTYTFGAGIREESFFIDFAYANTKSSEYDIQYIYSDGDGTNEGATVDNTISNFLLSLGFRF